VNLAVGEEAIARLVPDDSLLVKHARNEHAAVAGHVVVGRHHLPLVAGDGKAIVGAESVLEMRSI
jgi:hypothetical protein